jgi:TonB family protein
MASNVTTELVGVRSETEILPDFCLLQQKGLTARLWEELNRAAFDFIRNPSDFVKGLFASDSKYAKRQKLFYRGIAFAVVLHVTAGIVVVVASRNHEITELSSDKQEIVIIEPGPVGPGPSREALKTTSRNSAGKGANSGGGAGDLLPPTKGVPPQSLPRPSMVSIAPTTVLNASLLLNPSIPGDVSEPPPPDETLGDPNAKPGEFSAGPGKNGVAGTGNNTGVGSGTDPGSNRRGGGGPDTGGKKGDPEGQGGVEVLNYPTDRMRAGFSKFDWTYRAHPIVTPEAREKGVIGTVLLRATFNSDGTITDIEVIQPVEYMTDAAIESLKRCKFRPTTLFGKRVTLRNVPVKIEVHY